MPGRVRGGNRRPGGVAGYPSDRLYEEVAYVAYYFHWPYEQVMAMEHRERQRWIAEISRINERLNEEQGRRR
ncbi:MAG: hypothetical protein JO040_03715 [Gemmatimonadetes bacterium]|nr:hypothetical protein [Gemmatimonadota bacterium]